MSNETLKYEVKIIQRGSYDFRVVVEQDGRFIKSMDTSSPRGCATIAGLIMAMDIEDRDVFE